MGKLKNEKRINILLDNLYKHKEMSISELSEMFNVSNMTIYRDIRKLINDDYESIELEKGFVKLNKKSVEIPFALRNLQYQYEKKQIAKKAIEYIDDNDTIFIDGGSTSFTLANILANSNFLNLTIIVNSPIIQIELMKKKNTNIISFGGSLNRKNFVFYSEFYKNFLNSININKIFFSCTGFSIQEGYTEIIKEECELKKNIIEHYKYADISIIADFSKYDKIFTYTFGKINKFNRLITNNKINSKIIKKLKNYVDNLVVVE